MTTVRDVDLFWSGSLNAEALGNAFHGRKVGLYDTTLRDGEQTPGVVLQPDAKLAIARTLDQLGVGRIEAGFPQVSQQDLEAFRAVQEAGLRAEIWGFARALRADVDLLLGLGVRFAVIESPVSDLKLDAYGVSRQEMLDRIVTAVRYATQHGVYVAYFGVDGSRADPSFLETAYKSAVEVGANELVVVDTVGIATPEGVAQLVGRTRDWVGPLIPLHFHGHNDFGLATAAAIAAVREGATWIHGTINGMGERAGNANLIEVALALRGLYGVDTGLHLDRARDASRLVRDLSRCELEPWKPAVGENLFVRESGSVVSQFHLPPAIEPYSADLVGAQRKIVLGKKSGIDSIRMKCAEHELALSEEAQRALLADVKECAIAKGTLLTDEEFCELARRHQLGAAP